MFGNKLCIFCGKKLKRDWNFCPNCGFNVKESRIKKIEKRIPNIFSISLKFLPFSERAKAQKIFYKKIEPKIRKSLYQEKLEERKIFCKQANKNIEEPKIEIKEDEKKRNILVYLPEVENEKDIIIERYPQSIEIRAFGKDKLYFKLIPIPNYYKIEKSFNNGILKLEINKNIFINF